MQAQSSVFTIYIFTPKIILLYKGMDYLVVILNTQTMIAPWFTICIVIGRFKMVKVLLIGIWLFMLKLQKLLKNVQHLKEQIPARIQYFCCNIWWLLITLYLEDRKYFGGGGPKMAEYRTPNLYSSMNAKIRLEKFIRKNFYWTL